MRDLNITTEHIEKYKEDGFIVFEEFLDAEEIDRLKARFEPLFRGQWETGLAPDEVNWQYGRDRDDRTRQLCNTWRADYSVASVVLQPTIGRVAAQLSGWEGTRLHLDNVIWKPPGTSGLSMHQDGSYNHYMVPNVMTSLWMALTDTRADAGTVLYVRGSHKWGEAPKPESFLLEDYLAPMRHAAKDAGVSHPDVVAIEVPAGGLAVHSEWVWHGSGRNAADVSRQAVVAHCTPSTTRFHPTNTTHLYARYRRYADTSMDESFFPVLWTKDDYRTPWLDDYVERRGRKAS